MKQTLTVQSIEDTALTSLPDEVLLRRLTALTRDSRRTESELVAHIGEVDRRRLYAREACPSMFRYCTDVLHLSEHEAYLRITTARAARKHPQLLVMLADGRLHLAGIAKLASHLTVENRETLLQRATHRSKQQIEELLAELFPQPDAPALIRRLPTRTGTAQPGAPGAVAGAAFQVDAPSPSQEDRPKVAVGSVGGGGGRDVGDGGRGVGDGGRGHAGGALELQGELGPDRVAGDTSSGIEGNTPSPPPPSAAAVAGPALPVSDCRVDPIGPARYRVQFTASAELRDKLARLRDLMRSSVPDGDLATLIEEAITEKLARLERRKFACTQRPRKSLAESVTKPVSRYISAAVRRAVRERDGGQCAYVDEQGRRCSSRGPLEFHHRRPYGHGGDHSVGNVALMCRVHNRHLAEVDFGRAALSGRRSTERSRSASDAARLVGPGVCAAATSAPCLGSSALTG